MPHLTLRRAAALGAAVGALVCAPAPAQAAPGGLTLSPSCIQGWEEAPCTTGRAFGDQLRGPADMVPSPDGRFLYAQGRKSIAVLARDAATGALSQAAGPEGCIGGSGCNPISRGIPAEGEIEDVAVADNWLFALVTDHGSGSTYSRVLVLQRDPANGALTQAADATGCFASGGASSCTSTGPNDMLKAIVASRDGKDVYVFGQYQTDVKRYHRAATTFAYQPDDTVEAGGQGTDLVMTVDERSVYAVSQDTGTLITATRDPATGDLTRGQPWNATCISDQRPGDEICGGATAPISGAGELAVSADGSAVMVAHSYGVSIWVRDTTTGLLSAPTAPHGCVLDGASFGASEHCALGRRVEEGTGAAFSPDGAFAYAGSSGSDYDFSALTGFSRHSGGGLVQLAGADGCFTRTAFDACTTQEDVGAPTALWVSPDGRFLYTLNSGRIRSYAREIPPPPVVDEDEDEEEEQPGGEDKPKEEQRRPQTVAQPAAAPGPPAPTGGGPAAPLISKVVGQLRAVTPSTTDLTKIAGSGSLTFARTYSIGGVSTDRATITTAGGAAFAAKTVVLGTAKKTIPGPGTYKVRLKIGKAGRKALRRMKAARITLRTTFVDTAGRTTTTSTKLSLKRKKRR